MMNLRDALAGGGAVVGGLLFLAGNFVGEQVEPVNTIGLSGGAATLTAADICNLPETKFFLVEGVGDNRRFEAKYEIKDLDGVAIGPRYDLVWRPEGSVISVEELNGSDFSFRPEQVTQEFLDCVASKNVIPIVEGEQ